MSKREEKTNTKNIDWKAALLKNKKASKESQKTKSSSGVKKKGTQTSIKKTKDKKESSTKPKLQEEFDKKLKQAQEDNLYLMAEFENFKKRSAKERSELIRYSGEQLISSLANEVLDDLDRAIFSVEEEQSVENFKKGLEMIHKKLSHVLHRFGVEVLDPTGQAFDPSYQEALSHIKTSQIPEGHVAETFKKAYKLHDKVIRPAQVVLAKKEKE